MNDSILPSGWRKPCPMGGVCTDPGNPNDCQTNAICFPFNTPEEKAAFDVLPDQFAVQVRNDPIILFKTETQVKFFLTDLHFEDQYDSKVFKVY